MLFSAAMRRGKPLSEPAADNHAAKPAAESPLSLNRLRQAFAAMLGDQGAERNPRDAQPGEGDATQADPLSSGSVPTAQCEINPRSVVEAMLFVGRPDNGPIAA